MFSNNLVRTTRTRLSTGVVSPLSLSFAILATVLVALSCGFAQAGTITVATFADPSVGSGSPLFTVDLASDVITGGWAKGKTGLNLVIPYSGNTYPNAFFTMTPVSYAYDITGGVTGEGTVKFFDHDQLVSDTPLIQIVFDKGHVTPYGLGASDLAFLFGTGDNVVITGSEIGGATLTNETFSFSFANQQPLNGDSATGYTATASFTSSAIPEPSTLILLGIGLLGLLAYAWRRRRS